MGSPGGPQTWEVSTPVLLSRGKELPEREKGVGAMAGEG